MQRRQRTLSRQKADAQKTHAGGNRPRAHSPGLRSDNRGVASAALQHFNPSGNLIMRRIAIFAAVAAAIAMTPFARAADLPLKAPAAATINFTYPTMNGLIVEVFTEGGGSSVVASVPGVPPASLSTTTAGVGGTLGYMWTPKGSPISISVEGHIEAQNFNGNNAGLSVQGPLRLEGAVIAWAPWSRVFSALPNIWNPFASLSAFALPSGFVAQGNALAGLGLYYSAADISTAFQGLQAGKVWRGNPGLEAITAQPLVGGGAIRIFAKWDFLGNSKIFGAVPANSLATVSTLAENGYRAGIGYAF
jgi:hypothetical protein